ncbi:nck-associated protein 5-like isoform 1-T2 [Synchiropus picturatus]
MKNMADEMEQRMCDEDFGSTEDGEEADQESYLDDNSSELMDRLKELEAENSALMLANENQREAYERCLDEVANHVVQALLNQKDLREECIKLKMLVFDLERQNRALCELFQQKLPNHPTAHYQCPAGSIPEYNSQVHKDSSKQAVVGQTEAQAKGNGYPAQHAFPGPRGSAASMEALSPFFKKKAHILEVLRKMEETDPLKFHPSTGGLPFCDYSQVLMSTEAVLASAEPPAGQYKAQLPHCLCSCSDPPQRVNGDGAARCEGANTCCLHCKKSPGSHVCSPPSTDCPSVSRVAESAPSMVSDSHTADPPVVTSVPAMVRAKQEHVSEELTGFSPSSSTPSDCDSKTSDGAVQAPSRPSIDSSSERDGADPSTASISPSPSCFIDVKTVANHSPSKLLKFLKIPSIGEKPGAVAPAARLSPQLTRSSRIPCRTNNYEVYHSPVPTRRATTTERCRQPPPPPSRSESYPATHSAPTSPPQTEDICPLPAQDISYSNLSAPKLTPGTKMAAPSSHPQSSSRGSQKIPEYENVEDRPNRTRVPEPTQVPEKRASASSQTKAGGSERKLIKSLPESVLKQKHSSSSTSESSSDDEEDSDGPVWVNHQSLPSKPQSSLSYPRAREQPDVEASEAGKKIPEATQPPPPPRRSESSSIPKRPAHGAARAQPDSSHHAFKDRLAALSKLRSSEDLQGGSRPADPAGEAGVDGSEEQSRTGEPQKASQPAALLKQEASVVKTEGSKSRVALPSPSTDTAPGTRNNIKCPASLNLAQNVKVGNSPSRVTPKSPSKACLAPAVHRATKPPEAPRYSSRSEERTKAAGKGKKNPMYGDSLPSPPPRPPAAEVEKEPRPATSPHSAIEQKVMKGIEENMLKLQEQDRGAQSSEVKHKASNGIASWFGLKKSKLPALSRKTDATKGKEEKKEWKINIPSVGRDSAKVAARCREGVEGLNISTLMEKAEGLRRALEEERAYVERSGRGHSCEVVLDQTQGQLAVMYRGAHSDNNFMQQLLNRVDGKEVISLPQRRFSFDYKTSKPVFNSHASSRDDMERGSERVGKVTSEESMADSVHSQHFAGSGASTYTLDSGIGTFPLPVCSGAAGRGMSKSRTEPDSSHSPARAGRRARTLDREPTPQDEVYSASQKQLVPTIQYGSMLEGRGSSAIIHEDPELHGANMFSPRSKTWTFPNLEAPAGPADVYLAVEEEEVVEESVAFGSPYRANLKQSGASSNRSAEPGSLPLPPHSAMSRRGKSRTPNEAGLELLRERPEEALSPSRPHNLETPESLSDSLYDSLSSCGSQG